MSRPRSTYLTPWQQRRLDLACAPLRKAFPDYGPYLVDSVNERPDFRDVDVRVILVDKEWDRVFPDAKADDEGGAHDDARWTLLCAALTDWIAATSGLPVDVQIQRMSQANTCPKHEGKRRNPLGLRVWAP